MSENPDVSIIIPYQRTNDYLLETLKNIQALNHCCFEVILLPDGDDFSQEFEKFIFPVRVIPTGNVSPAIKRDIGSNESSGKFLAFIDDDAYPDKNWLYHTISHFDNPTIAAVGGPQITPHSDSFWQKVSGAMFLSILNGDTVCRYWPGKKSRYVEDWPSVNLIVRKEDFKAVGGFDNAYWPGEDTKFCLDIVKTLHKKIIYEPKAKVFHHRRAGFLKHLKQIGNYGIHRGFFAKRFPETSLKLAYFIPSCFFIFISAGWLTLYSNEFIRMVYTSIWLLYITAMFFSVLSIYIKIKSFRIAMSTVPYLIATHFWYGWRFLKGFILTRELKSQLGR